MTNHWIDIKNSNCIMVIGSNAAENHPLSFKWVTKAMEGGAKLISVDPRFTRTSSKADIYARIRSGTDIAFISGMIKYVIEDIERNPQNYNMTYIKEYTNATLLIDPDFKGPADLDGLFCGYDAGKRAYDRSKWAYQLDDKGIPKRDTSLKDSNCVFQLLKKHFSRYDVDTVCKITGTSKDVYRKVCKTYSATGRSDKSATIIYAMGTTQHTYATQNIRSYAILQLLLGNIGVAGGGINAARGQSNVQGSTDHSILYHILPGYLKTPHPEDVNLRAYLKHYTPTTDDPMSANWWQNYDKYIVSLLKAWYGNAANASNNFAYEYLPKVDGDHSHIATSEAMYDGVIKGLISPGHNTAVSGPNAGMEREALDKLDWLVVWDLWETETASFWKRPGVDPSQIKTEVFLLPAKASMEREGSITNSGRWMQWRYECCDAPGVAKSDLWIVTKLVRKLKELYAREGGKYPDPIINLTWDYGNEPDVHKVAKEINGYDRNSGHLLPSFTKLKADGSTSSGNWLYCGSYTEGGNMSARRDLTQTPAQAKIGLYPNWSWCWPVNRRILYNRASVDLDGNPFNSGKSVISWHPILAKWEGDIPDGGWVPMSQDGTKLPFIMTSEGRGHLFAPGEALKDGPIPEHYEPWESPVKNLISGTQNDPAITIWDSLKDLKGDPSKYPIIATTYRLSEHWQAGQMTRNLPWLVELMPEMFVELSEELAREKGIQNGRKVVVESARGKIEAVAVVTKRFVPLSIDGRKVHQIGMPWHWGYMGLSTGDSANMLTPNIGDANTTIPEYKAFLCNIRAK
jgi:formate dehydrogenase major subunit